MTDHSAISSDNLLQVLDQRITRAFISVRAFVFFVSVIVVKGSPHRDRTVMTITMHSISSSSIRLNGNVLIAIERAPMTLVIRRGTGT